MLVKIKKLNVEKHRFVQPESKIKNLKSEISKAIPVRAIY